MQKKSQSIVAILEQISSGVRVKKPLQEIFDLIVPLTIQALEAQSAAVWLVAKEGDRLELAASYNLKKEVVEYFKPKEHWPRPEEGIVGKAFGEKRCFVERNILERADVPEAWKELIRQGVFDFKTLLANPLLIEDGKVVGVLNLYFAEDRKFAEKEFNILRIIANYLGTAIEARTLLDSVQQNRNELEAERDQLSALQQATQFLSISTEKPLLEILNELLQNIGKAIHASAIALWRPTLDGKHLYIYAHQGMTENYVTLFNSRPLSMTGQNVVGTVASTRKPYFLPDVQKFPWNEDIDKKRLKVAISEKVLSIASLPVVVNGELFGVLNFYFTDPKNYAAQEQYILGVVSNIFSIAIGNSQYREELQKERDQLAKLQQGVEALSISSATSLHDLLLKLVNTVGEAVSTQAIALWRPSQDKKFLQPAIASGLPEDYIESFRKYPVPLNAQTIVGEAASRRAPVFSGNLQIRKRNKIYSDKLIERMEQANIHSVASFPLTIENELFGVLNFYFSQRRTYTPNEQYILQVAANTVAIAIGNVQYRQELEDAQRALLNILEDTDEAKRRAEQERNKTQLIITHFMDGLIVFNSEGRVDLANPRAEYLLSATAEEMFGKSIEELGSIPAFAPVLQVVQKQEESVDRKEVEIGKGITVEITTVALGTETEKGGTTIVLHDVTREKQIERLKTEFVSLAAHQLRTPLSAIKWTLRMLLDGDVGAISKEQKEFLDRTYTSNERMIMLINDLLDVTRIEEGRYLYKPSFVQLEAIVENAVRMYKEEAEKKKITLSFENPKERLPHVLVDAEKIMLAVQNLIDNAIRYTASGGKIRVGLETKQGKMQVFVSDNGVGIPADEQKRIFQKFFRASNVRTLDTEGSGLGLYIIKNIVEAHGGTVWFDSEVQKGTTFYFTLPMRQEMEEFLKKF
ncbi:MAG: GAF domain-containing protein [Candidatus Wildermuthbacteria bacterium]|nr:GAF domain-containing protein [Candidatus Wildermuthbacteria bacterium]